MFSGLVGSGVRGGAVDLFSGFVGGGVRGGAVGVCFVFGNERDRVWVRREGAVSG